jgi:hypothetical protein
MKVFVGYGYNHRDAWVESHVFPILSSAGFTVVHGKDMHGQELKPEVERRIEQSDAVIGFFTVRDGQADAEFNSHIWVRDELLWAKSKEKPIVPVREEGAKVPPALLGNPQFIKLDQADRLACVAEILQALGRRNIRRLRLDPGADALRADLWRWRNEPGFNVRYHTQDSQGLESSYRNGRLELIDQGFFLNVIDIPDRGLVEVEGERGGQIRFSSGWVSTDAVQVRIS